MPSVSLSPILNAQVVRDSGAPASGWKIFSYVAGSSTPLPAYTDASGSVAHSNPILLNASGFATQGQIWLEDGRQYKFVLADDNSVPQRTFDDISGVNDPSQISADQWQDFGTVATYISAYSFSLVSDQVGEYHVGRRVQLKQGTGFVYGTITGSSYAPLSQLTTVTLQLDDAAVLTTALSQSNLSLLRADHHALPKINYALDSLTVGTINATTINMSGADNWAAQVTLPSAATVDIGAAASNSIRITGTSTINSFGTAAAGLLRMVEFQSSLTLTCNATSLQLPGAGNITTQPGDVLFAYSKGAGNWRVVAYQPAASAPGSFSIPRLQAITSSGNFVVPAGVTRLRVTVVGGGGSGTAGSTGGDGGAFITGGCGGGCAIKVIDGLVPGQSIAVVIGAGAPAGGGTGGTSSFGAFCSATGGGSVAPGVGIGGDLNIPGGTGGTDQTANSALGVPVAGGSFLSPPSASAALYGGSGVGGTVGAPGVVIVEY